MGGGGGLRFGRTGSDLLEVGPDGGPGPWGVDCDSGGGVSVRIYEKRSMSLKSRMVAVCVSESSLRSGVSGGEEDMGVSDSCLLALRGGTETAFFGALLVGEG